MNRDQARLLVAMLGERPAIKALTDTIDMLKLPHSNRDTFVRRYDVIYAFACGKNIEWLNTKKVWNITDVMNWDSAGIDFRIEKRRPKIGDRITGANRAINVYEIVMTTSNGNFVCLDGDAVIVVDDELKSVNSISSYRFVE